MVASSGLKSLRPKLPAAGLHAPSGCLNFRLAMCLGTQLLPQLSSAALASLHRHVAGEHQLQGLLHLQETRVEAPMTRLPRHVPHLARAPLPACQRSSPSRSETDGSLLQDAEYRHEQVDGRARTGSYFILAPDTGSGSKSHFRVCFAHYDTE